MWTTNTKMHVILVNMNPGNGFVTFTINLDIDICDPEPPFPERTDVLTQDLMNSQSREIRVKTFHSLCNLTDTLAAAMSTSLNNTQYR